MNNDMIFILVIAAFIGYYMCKKEGFFGTTEDFGQVEDDAARRAVKEIYTADIEAIRNLSEVSKKLQAGGITVPGTMTAHSGNWHIPIVAASNGEAHIALRSHNNEGINNYLINRGGHFRLHHHGVDDMFGVDRNGHTWNKSNVDHVAHHIGTGVNAKNPYITISRAGEWGNSSWYMQNVHNDHPSNSTFRIGKHDVGAKLDIGSDGYLNASGVRLGGNADVSGDIVTTGGNNWVFHTPDDNRHIMYIAPSKAYGNRDWNWGNATELKSDGDVVIKGKLTVGGRNILAELDDIKNNFIRTGQRMHMQSAGDGNRWLSEKNGGAEVRGHRGIWSQFNIHKA